MLRRSFICSLVAVMTIAVMSPTMAAAGPDRAEKARAEVRKISRVPDVLVTVKTIDGQKSKGYVTQVLDDSFDLTDRETRKITTIPYDEVDSIKKDGWSRGAKIALGVGIGAAIVIGVIAGSKRGLGGGFCPLGCNTILRP